LDQADFYDTAALMQNLNLVITIDTSVFHLAAAMGIETWVALIEHPEWRFGQQERTESYWYGNTRYFRQSKKDCWTDVIDHIRDALAERIRN
jgi:ADP-heptose:LPS heptosyltransferase